MSTPQKRVVALAKSQVGYVPPVGKWNKYAEALDKTDLYNYAKNGYDWCDVFYDWRLVQEFGVEVAKAMTNQPSRGCGAGLLIETLKGAVLAQMSAVPAGDPQECPRCHHAHVVRKGRDANGQRWLCAGCGRTFGATTAGLLAQSKLGPETWAAYVEHMVAGETLKRCADLVGVCLKTSWFMRMRVCEVMRYVLAPFRGGAGLSVQIDEKYLDESLCGNRGRARAKMPGEPHRNGNSVRKGGSPSSRSAWPRWPTTRATASARWSGAASPPRERSGRASPAPTSRGRRSPPTPSAPTCRRCARPASPPTAGTTPAPATASAWSTRCTSA